MLVDTTQTTTTTAPAVTDEIFIPEPPEFTIGYKTKHKGRKLFAIGSPSDGAAVARKCFEEGSIGWVESFVVLALNKSNKVLGFYRVSTGGVTGTVADPKVILQFALLCNATSLILCHNHPSGSLRPSAADEELTYKIKTACSYMDIKVLDHFIVTPDDGYYSFADAGLL